MTLLRLASARTFRSLRHHHNYRLFFFGQLTSVAGTWMQNIALAWAVVQLAPAPEADSPSALLAICRFGPFTAARPLRGRDHRPVRQPAHRDRHPVASRWCSPRCSPALALTGQLTLAYLYVIAFVDRHRDRVRRAVAAEPDVPDGRPGRAAERRRAQLEPVQHGAHLRAGARGDRDRGRRHRLVLR